MTALTDLLVSPTGTPLGPDDRATLRTELDARLADDPRLRTACGRFGPRDLSDARRGRRRSFAWTARAAGRLLGLEALEGAVRSPDQGLAPAEAVAAALDRLRTSGGVGYGTSLAAWAAGWSDGTAAVVAAEATTWCTRMLCALDWDRLGTDLAFGADHWWRPAAPPSLVLQARSDIVVTTGAGASPAPSLLVVQTGCPVEECRMPLAFTGLVATLDRRSEGTPARVVGFWPDCGRSVAITMDRSALDVALDAAVQAAARRSGRAAHLRA